MEKEEIHSFFNSLNEEKRKLELQIEEVLEKKVTFIEKNKAIIKEKYMPKSGDIFYVTDYFLEKNYNVLRYYGKNREAKYIKITTTRLCKRDYENNLHPTVPITVLDEEFNVIIDYGMHLHVCDLGEKAPKGVNYNLPTQIYVMIDKNTGLYKIGRSKNPTIREKTLQSEKPTIELMLYWSGFTNDEKFLHEKYRDKRVRGEWFSLDYIDIESIKSYFKEKEFN